MSRIGTRFVKNKWPSFGNDSDDIAFRQPCAKLTKVKQCLRLSVAMRLAKKSYRLTCETPEIHGNHKFLSVKKVLLIEYEPRCCWFYSVSVSALPPPLREFLRCKVWFSALQKNSTTNQRSLCLRKITNVTVR